MKISFFSSILVVKSIGHVSFDAIIPGIKEVLSMKSFVCFSLADYPTIPI